MAMQAVVWGDPICPWCYVGQRRTELLRSLDVEVTHRPYELHPETPPEGRPLVARPGGRVEAVYGRLADLARSEGLPFVMPTRTPRTARALATAEVVRATDPVAAEALWGVLFAAHFAEGLDLGDPSVLVELVDRVTGTGQDVADRVADGAGRAELEAERERALEAGVVGAPTWWLDERLLIAGLQEPAWFERVVGRFRERSG